MADQPTTPNSLSNAPKSMPYIQTVGLEDKKNDKADNDTISGVEPDTLIGFLKERWNRAMLARRKDETRCLKAYQNFRGIYGSEVSFRADEKSRVFIKITKTKVMAAYSQLIDVLFAANRFPLSVEPSALPEGIKDTIHIDPPNAQKADTNEIKDIHGYAGDGKDIPPGTTAADLLGPLAKELKDQPIKDGPGEIPGSITLEPAMVAAKKMEKKIMDQLERSNASEHLRAAAFECVLFGSGILKGPLACDMEYEKWNKDGVYAPIVKTMPTLDHVSFWNLYPDPDATRKENADFFIERHKMTREMLRDLKKRPYFRADTIEECISEPPRYVKQWWEDTLRDFPISFNVDRYEVLEYWGTVDAQLAEEAGLELPKEVKDQDSIQCNIWICGNHILRVVLNPFVPKRTPYYIVPYELNPYTIFGVGIGENMEDTQTLMNGFMRLGVDNAVLSGNVILEIDENLMAPGQDMALTPGKMFRRNGGVPGQAMYAINIPNITQENMQMFDKARELADESTGIPSYSHGQTGIGGVTRTASGMSMLMGAAAGNIKTVVKNFDDYLLRPIGEGFFSFNQQFDYDPELNDELEIKARGTDSLMQNEVRSQRLMTFLQIVSNPMLAPFAKMPYIVRQIAKSLDLDEDKVTNNMDEALLVAYKLQAMGGMQTPGAPNGSPSGTANNAPTPPPGANINSPTGGGAGQASPGVPANPNNPGFSANTGQQ